MWLPCLLESPPARSSLACHSILFHSAAAVKMNNGWADRLTEGTESPLYRCNTTHAGEYVAVTLLLLITFMGYHAEILINTRWKQVSEKSGTNTCWSEAGCAVASVGVP